MATLFLQRKSTSSRIPNFHQFSGKAQLDSKSWREHGKRIAILQHVVLKEQHPMSCVSQPLASLPNHGICMFDHFWLSHLGVWKWGTIQKMATLLDANMMMM
jgi:hypothetical protein